MLAFHPSLCRRGAIRSMSGVMAGFVPLDPFVMHQVLLTPQNPQRVAAAVLACTTGEGKGGAGVGLVTKD